jgi:hypothetical protein
MLVRVISPIELLSSLKLISKAPRAAPAPAEVESKQEPARREPYVPHRTCELIAEGNACDGDRQDA